ncbi:MAG: hypothetical protein ABSB96_01000 [Gaiellaceae bacterium]
MSNYYEILGVWRDASSSDIDLASQTLFEHWQAQLALRDPLASDWLQIIEQARSTLLDMDARLAYDRLLAAPVEETPVFAPGFPWRAYLCALLTVPVILAAFVLVLAGIANSAFLTNSTEFGDTLLTTMIVASAVAAPCGLIVLMIAARGREAERRLRVLETRTGVDPAALAQIEAASRLSEFTDVAVWVTWGAEAVIVAFWVWFVVLLVAVGI